jgi:hypothetical protein
MLQLWQIWAGVNMLRSIQNQYRGINAHLHSVWQATSTWHHFHNVYIAALMQAFNAQLRHLQYVAEIEDALQIRRDDNTQAIYRPDVSLYDVDPARTFQHGLAPEQVAAGTTVLALPDMLADPYPDDKPYRALAIRALNPETGLSGELVAWLELLSPSNKGTHQHARDYQRKRLDILESGVVFIELDFLHEYLPTFERIVPYQPHVPHAHPYRVLIIDPRPHIDSGVVYMHEFDVDTPLPTMIIPLNGSDRLTFDFDVVYQATFSASFYGDKVDYALLPMHFETYTESDQARILTRLVAVLTAAQRGDTLEQPPQALETLPFDAALKQYQVFQAAP